MAILKYVFVLLHITTAAAWFGLSLSLSAQSRAAVQQGGAAVLASGARALDLMGTSLLLTFLFALGALFTGGGFAVYGAPYHTSITLIVVMIGVHFTWVQSAWKGLGKRLQEGDTAAARSRRRRLAMGVGLSHALWLGILVMMYWLQIRAVL
ncbi:MAG: hypothetical protein AAGI71_14120 [Bacteroidota bacterium]